jgi:hypothetical protein
MSRGARDVGGNFGRGSHWIRDEKRHAIYERDGWTCWVCGCRVLTDPMLRAGASGALATLDHVVPRLLGGTNDACNLVTCCGEHNAARGDKPAVEWLIDQEEGVDWMAALSRLLARVCTPLTSARCRHLAAPQAAE